MSYAQSEFARKETDNKETVIFAEFQKDSAKTIKEAKTLLKQIIAVDKNEEFVLTDTQTDKLGFTHQYLRHIKL